MYSAQVLQDHIYVDMNPVFLAVDTNPVFLAADRLRDYTVEVFDTDPSQAAATGKLCTVYLGPSTVLGERVHMMCVKPITGRYVKISKTGANLQICELEVLEAKPEGN